MTVCEGHLTFDKSQPNTVIKSIGLNFGFHYSYIDGWDEIGEGGNQFLTSHGDVLFLNARMDQVIEALKIWGIACKRKKIESLILDERY